MHNQHIPHHRPEPLIPPTPANDAIAAFDTPCSQGIRRMEKHNPFVLIDSDQRRRADICYKLAGIGILVEPFDDIDELSASSPANAVLLAEDTGAGIPGLIDCMIESGHWWPVIAFSDQPDTTRIVQAMLSGAANYLRWPCDPAIVAEAYYAAQADSHAVISRKMREMRALSQLNILTSREREVLSWITHGFSNHMIAEALTISPRTVEIHRANLLRKMGVKNTSDAIRIAVEASLLGPGYALDSKTVESGGPSDEEPCCS